MSEEIKEQTQPSSKGGISWARILGALLIAAAIAMYIRTTHQREKMAEAANAVSQAVLVNGVSRVGVAHTLEGMELPPILHLCDEGMTTNLLVSLLQAKPTATPKKAIEGDLFVVHVMGTNNTVQLFRAVRPASDPANALVGVISMAKDEDGNAVETVSAPALAVGAGEILGSVLKRMVEEGSKISSDPGFRESFSNLLERAVNEHDAAKTKPEEAPVEAATPAAAEPLP